MPAFSFFQNYFFIIIAFCVVVVGCQTRSNTSTQSTTEENIFEYQNPIKKDRVPYLVIDPIDFVDGIITLDGPTYTVQTIKY